MLEIYGGNATKLRTEADFFKKEDDQTYGVNFKEELKHLSRHFKNGYVELKKPKAFNPDCE